MLRNLLKAGHAVVAYGRSSAKLDVWVKDGGATVVFLPITSFVQQVLVSLIGEGKGDLDHSARIPNSGSAPRFWSGDRPRLHGRPHDPVGSQETAPASPLIFCLQSRNSRSTMPFASVQGTPPALCPTPHRSPEFTMQLQHNLTAVAASLLLFAPISCPIPRGATMAVIGDSLSAGFQNDSLLDTQQPHGWASLVARQAGVPLTLPLIAPPGAPAVLQLVSLGPPPVIRQAFGITIGRTNPGEQPWDLAVPGHDLNDIINDAPKLIPTSDEDIITNLVLGLPLGDDKSQMNEAVVLDPQSLFIWAGNEDALQADEAGTPTAMTPVSTFAAEFQQLIGTLHATNRSVLIVANVPDVTIVPYLTPAAAIIAEVSQQTGAPASLVANELGIVPGDLINATGLIQVENAVAALKAGQTPAPLTDAGFLDPDEIAEVQATVQRYNSIIGEEVGAVGGVLVDIHTYVEQLSQNGVTINGYHATNAFLGGLFSLDGIHPTNTAYALIANQFIQTMNSSLKTSIPQVLVSEVAAADPLFGLHIQPTAARVHISGVAARQTDHVLLRHKLREPPI